MRPGDLSERVTFESYAETADGMGGQAVAWSTFATVWAKVRPISGRERAQAGGLEAPANYEFTIRRRADLTESMRLTWRGETYNVRFIAVPPAGDLYMRIEAERDVAT
jgi:SPP1 family predicted phage head-tail adaptor